MKNFNEDLKALSVILFLVVILIAIVGFVAIAPTHWFF